MGYLIVILALFGTYVAVDRACCGIASLSRRARERVRWAYFAWRQRRAHDRTIDARTRVQQRQADAMMALAMGLQGAMRALAERNAKLRRDDVPIAIADIDAALPDDLEHFS